jgi:hypothetical protein
LDIKTQCKCGTILKAKQELAGKQVKCPKCGDVVLIPKPDSIRLTCSCGQIIQAKASLAGKRVKCPTCNQPIGIPSGTGMPSLAVLSPAVLSPAVLSPAKVNNSTSLGDALMQLPVTTETEFATSFWNDLAKTNTDGKRSAASRQSGSLNWVQLGITFIYFGVLLFVAAIIVGVLALPLKAPLLIIGGLLMSAASSLLSTIGRILCLTVPKQVGARALIYFSVAFDITALLLTVSRMIPGMQYLSGFSGLVNVLGIVLFVIFLKKLAIYINSNDLAQRASEVLSLWAVWAVLFVFGLVGASMSAIFVMIVVLPGFVLSLLACFRYFQLLSELRLSLGYHDSFR